MYFCDVSKIVVNSKITNVSGTLAPKCSKGSESISMHPLGLDTCLHTTIFKFLSRFSSLIIRLFQNADEFNSAKYTAILVLVILGDCLENPPGGC